MPDTTDNVIFEVFGNTAEFATDYGTSGIGFTQAHVQIVKLAFGDNSKTDRIYANNPLPVTVSGNSGGIQGISGEVSGTGGFKVRNFMSGWVGTSLEYLAVAGSTSGDMVGISGSVYGLSGGFPVAVTGDISVTNRVTILGPTGSAFFREFGATAGTMFNIDGTLVTGGFWPVVVTGGRRLNSSLDSITVSGSVNATGGRFLAAGTDSVSVLGSDLGSKVLTKIYGSSGETLGVSGDALKVALVNSGVTFSLSIATGIGVTNSPSTALFINGNTGAYPVTVRGQNDGAIEVAATSPLNVNVNNSSLVIDDDDILAKLGTTGDIYSKLNTVATNTSSISTIRTDLQNGSANVTVNQINRPGSMVVGSKKISSDQGAVQMSTSSILKSGITIKASPNNSGDVYIGSATVARNVNNGYPLSPGETLFLEVNNANLIYIRSNGGSQSVNYIGS